jgi:hypothetical protein
MVDLSTSADLRLLVFYWPCQRHEGSGTRGLTIKHVDLASIEIKNYGIFILRTFA